MVVALAVAVGLNVSSCAQKNKLETVESNLKDSVASYLVIQAALSSDSIEGVKEAAAKVAASANAAIKIAEKDKDKNKAIIEATKKLAEAATALNKDGLTLESAREGFHALSDSIITIANKRLAGDATADLNQFHCPMAKGNWLQKGEDTANPYYGAKMLKCGSKVEMAAGCNCKDKEKCSHTKDGEGCDHAKCEKCKKGEKCEKCMAAEKCENCKKGEKCPHHDSAVEEQNHSNMDEHMHDHK